MRYFTQYLVYLNVYLRLVGSQQNFCHLGTKTPYMAAAACNHGQEYKIPQWCRPVHVNSLIRHGIRNAGIKDISRFTEAYSKLTPFIKQSHQHLYSSFQSVAEKITSVEPKQLLEAGRLEQKALANRIFLQFGDVFDSIHTSEHADIEFISSSTPRAKESCEAFIEEWQQISNNVEFNPTIKIDDKVLRFFDKCKKYDSEVNDRRRVALNEYYAFKDAHFASIAENVNNKFAVQGNLLNAEEMKALYIMAGIELSTISGYELARLFSKSDLKKMEYAADLKNYWKKSYGHPINYRQSCPLLMEMLNGLEEFRSGVRRRSAVFRFAHAETLMPVLALIGLFKDPEVLRADNYHLQQNRHFRSSHMSPFSANIMWVLLECDQESYLKNRPLDTADWPDTWEPYFVLLLVNEVPRKIPGCSSMYCPYSQLKEIYGPVLKSCMEDICENDLDFSNHIHNEL